MTSVDLPPPETPVTQVNSAERNFRRDVLQVVAARVDDLDGAAMVRRRAAPARRLTSSPVRYWPVSEFGLRMISAGVPCATIWPPCTPAPGPMSRT